MVDPGPFYEVEGVDPQPSSAEAGDPTHDAISKKAETQKSLAQKTRADFGEMKMLILLLCRCRRLRRWGLNRRRDQFFSFPMPHYSIEEQQ